LGDVAQRRNFPSTPGARRTPIDAAHNQGEIPRGDPYILKIEIRAALSGLASASAVETLGHKPRRKALRQHWPQNGSHQYHDEYSIEHPAVEQRLAVCRGCPGGPR
jgi:hypothetical protein